MSQAPELEIIVMKPGGRLLGSFVHAETRIVIGSGATATIVIADAGLAAEHAIVHFTGRSCILEVMPGVGPFSVNGESVESHLVQAQDTITLGTHTLRFVVHRGAGAPQPPHSRQVVSEDETTAVSPPPAAARAKAVTLVPPPGEDDGPTRVTPIAPNKRADEEKAREEAGKKAATEAAKKIAAAESAKKTAAQKNDIQTTQPKKAEPAKKAEAPKRAPQTIGALALKLEPLPASDHDAEEEDDEDEDEDFVPFSLLDALAKSAVSAKGAKALIVEAVYARDNGVQKVVHIPPGGAITLNTLKLRYETSGALVVTGAKARGQAQRDGKIIALDSLTKPGADGPEIHVTPGVRVQLDLGRDAIVLQHTALAVAPPPATRGMKLDREDTAALIAAVILHLLAVIVFGLSGTGNENAAESTEGRYVEVKIKDLELEPPPPPPPQETPTPETPQPQAKAAPQKKAPKTPQAKAAPAAPAAAPQKPSAAANLLSALGGGLSAPSASNALAAASNLDAVAAPKGAGFKVSGVIGKMPGNDLKLGSAGSGVGRIDTKSVNELTGGGKLGKVQGSAPSGKVRGVVEGPPPKSVQIQGSLDRSEIQKVVNDHLHEVQGCYERQLVKDPSLAGKILSEWVITPQGTVGTVKIKSSSVRNNEVANCIQAALKRWKFPQPKGGPVTVTYPFVFSTIGM